MEDRTSVSQEIFPENKQHDNIGSALTLTEPLDVKRKYEEILPATSSPPGKRGRGRPKGTGKLQLLSSLGRFAVETAGGSFTPHVMTVTAGEDIVSRIKAFAQKGPRAVCVLSAVGGVVNATIRQTSGVLLRYEGQFDILSLSGSYVFSPPAAGSSWRRKNGMLTVSLARSDGNVFGGSVAGPLIAAHPILLIVGSFKQDIGSTLIKKLSSEASPGDAVGAPGDAGGAPAKAEIDDSCITATTSGVGETITGVMIDPPSTLSFQLPMPPMLDQSSFPDSDNIFPKI